MSEQRDGTGTGTGVWTHQAAETGQPEQRRCECGACEFEAGPMAWYWQPMQEKMLRRVHEYSHLRIYPNDCGFAHCPGECGCRLSVVDGEPRVGEPYADLERDAKRFRAVAANVDDAAAYAYLQIGEHALRSSLRVRQEGIFEGLRKAVAIIQEHRGGETDEHDA